MIRLVAGRLAQAILTLAIAVTVVFFAIRFLPGHPVLVRFGQHRDAEQIRKIRQEQGWDRPLWNQLGDYLGRLVFRGDLGESLIRSNERISAEMLRRIPATFELSLAAMSIAIPLGVGFGSAAAVWTKRLPDFVCHGVSLVGVSIPVFFLGLFLRSAIPSMPVGFRLPIRVTDFEPITGLYLLDTLWCGDIDLFLAVLRHLCLPAITLSTIPTAYIAQVTRVSMLDVARADFVRTAVAKGASRWKIVWRHIFPNAAPPVVSMMMYQLGTLMSGAVLTESVFDWPGLGKYIVDAVQKNDYTVVQAGCLFVAATFIVVNLTLDLALLWLDPRIRTHETRRG